MTSLKDRIALAKGMCPICKTCTLTRIATSNLFICSVCGNAFTKPEEKLRS
jgi:ribosomal protein L37AE/L43A